MNINIVRKIDYFIGIPLSLLLTIINQLINLFKKKEEIEFCPHNILLIELSEIGSTILAYPAIQKLIRAYPDANIIFLIFERNRPGIELLNVIKDKNILTIRDDSWVNFFIDTINVLIKLHKIKIDISIDLELFSRFTNILSYLCGARYRIGFNNYYGEGLYRGNLQTHRVYYNPYQHITLNFMALISSLKYPADDCPLIKGRVDLEEINMLKIPLNEERQTAIWKKLKAINPHINESNRKIIINPNAGKFLPIRAWPLVKYIKLIEKLLTDKNNYIIIIGNQEAFSDAELIIGSVNNDRCLNLVGKTTIAELIDLNNISEIIVTNDSGPAHFASLSSIKIVVLFGPETPDLYKPLGHNVTTIYSSYSCSPCLTAYNHRNSPCNDNKCLKSITVDEVYKIIERLL